jgi:cytochrome c-type biogenesis protein CcmF
VTRDVRMLPGHIAEVGGYTFRFDGVTETKGPNWVAEQGVVTVSRHGSIVAVMHPQKRTYAYEQVQTESAIDPGATRDLYVALGEPMDPNHIEGAWALRLYTKPFIRWIWGGGLLMMLGGFVSAGDRRFRVKREAEVMQTIAMPVQESQA